MLHALVVVAISNVDSEPTSSGLWRFAEWFAALDPPPLLHLPANCWSQQGL